MDSIKSGQNRFFDDQVFPMQNNIRQFPNRNEVAKFADAIFEFLFTFGPNRAESLQNQWTDIAGLLASLLDTLDADVDQVVDDLVAELPMLYSTLLEDAQAALELDPAAESLTEVIACYPGFYAIAIYRLAHQLSLLGVSLLPRMLSAYAQGKTGIDIHPAAQIGHSFVIDHGTGIVIGATTKLGDHVTLYHGVTLGALQVNKSSAQNKRHPTIQDHVTIYANATVLGGETVIGQGSVIGANAWVTRSVSPNCLLYFDGRSTVERSSDYKPSKTNKPAATVNLKAINQAMVQWFASQFKFQSRHPLFLNKTT